MRYGRGHLHWYDLVLGGLATVIVFPDEVLDRIGDHTGRDFGWEHVLLLEVIAIGSMVALMALLTPMYPVLNWWYPLLLVGMLGFVRAIMWCVAAFFGFDD